MPVFANRILGKWVIDESDNDAIARYGRTSLEFRSDGSLLYTIHGDDVDQKMFLSYQIDGNTLITDQPSSPMMARTEFMFGDDGKLVLFFDGVPSFYRYCEEHVDSDAGANDSRGSRSGDSDDA